MNTIVLATDGSPSAEKATRLAIELARETGARLCVSAVWNARLASYSYAPLAVIPDIEKAEKERAYHAARSAVQLAAAEGVEAKPYVRAGDPVDVIAQTAADCGASLLVVGSHGWGPVRRFVFGSVSTALLHEAPCPILVAPSDHDATTTKSAQDERAVA